MPAQLIVKATMQEPGARADFDAWYQTHHLPDATAAFRADSAWRGWSEIDPQVHYAIYQFATVAEALAIIQSEAIITLIAEFDETWQGRVERTRDVVETCQFIQGC